MVETDVPQRTARLRGLSESEKFALICSQQYKLNEMQKTVETLKCAHETGQCVHCADKDKTISDLNEKIKDLQAKIYGRSSERRRVGKPGGGGSQKPKSETRVRLPSEQYPNAKIKVETLTEPKPPKCTICDESMTDSGMRETSERLELIPMEIFIVKTERVRYHCKCCQGAPITTALPARIAPHTSLNDSVLIEASLAKFYDLIPTQRFAKMLARSSIAVSDKLLFSAQSYLAQAFISVYVMLKQEVLESRVVHADESPHRMLERNENNYLWYLWSFCNQTAVYFEIHNTRAGSVSIEFLRESKALFLLSDVYSGYVRTIREVNEHRQSKGVDLLQSAHCNDHARRYFFYAKDQALAEQVLDVYDKIYSIEAKVQEMIKTPIHVEPENSEEALKLRLAADLHFQEIYDLSGKILLQHTFSSAIGKAANYFLKNATGLTRFLTDIEIPISNAPAERSVRNPAIGRKTWYGTHSRKGAEIAAIHFSLFETCRLNQVNPREYYRHLAERYRNGQPLITPYQYTKTSQAKPPSDS